MKVLIQGTGFAGEGHADAFRAAGAQIVGIVGRTPSVVSEVAGKKGIAFHGTDWKAALESCQPDNRLDCDAGWSTLRTHKTGH